MRKILFSLVLVASPLAAQQSQEGAGEAITVLASGVREPILSTGQQISVFDRAQIEAVQGPDLTRLLERAPGVSVSRNGPPGSFTGVRVRGAEAEQLLVLVDGVRLADNAAPAGGFDFGTLAMGNLARVELQRSSNSTIWGSEAIGGVLAVETLARVGGDASVEGGTRGALYAAGGGGLRSGPAFFSLRGGYLSDAGFSAADAGSEKDGVRQRELAAGTELDVTRGLQLFARSRYARSRVEIDGFPPPDYLLADTAERQITRQLSGVGGLRYRSDALQLSAAYSQADTERDSIDPSFGETPGYTTDGASRRAELRGRAALAQDIALDFGAEREWTSFATLFDARRRSAISGAYLQADYGGGPVHLAVGLRRDEHREFGGAWSMGADAAYALGGAWRLTASYGEGFKAPSLFQLFSDYGNRGLRPETSRSFDVGVHGALGPARVLVIGFRRDTDELIGFVSCFGRTDGICQDRPFGTYDNTRRARAQGLEAEGVLDLTGAMRMTLAYAYVEALDRDTRLDLARRPRHALTLSGDWRGDRVSLGADLRALSHSFDDPANAVRIGGHATLALRGEWQASEMVALFARVENLWNESYQTAAGYGTPGRVAFVGARTAW